MSTKSDLGIGLIGAGSMAHAYAECLTRYTTAARLVAVAGGRRAGVLASTYGVAVEPTVESLLRRADLSAVIIATPEMLHGEQTLLAAAAGRHVLVEKPMAPTVQVCDDMIAACARAGVKLMVVKHWRFRGVHRRALEWLRSGTGAVHRIRNHTLTPRTSSLVTVSKKPFYLDPAGGGLLMGWAVHNLDWVRYLAGAEPLSLSASLAPAGAPLGEGSLEAEIQFANRVVAEVRVAIDRPSDPGSEQVFRTRISSERGELELDGYRHLRTIEQGGESVLWTQPAFDPRDPVDPRRLEAYALMLQGFIDSIRFDQSPPVTGHDGRTAVAMYQAIRQAASHRRVVNFTLV